MNNPLQSIKLRFGIIGHSPLLDRALDTAVRVAPTDLTVLILGESGVGKEVFSRIIHALSPRKHNSFIAINCGAIPEGTINSELFGHEKGAFTGATGDRKGYFETVNGGTIFLDEIAEMPLDTQAYLLRVLESGEFIRVGSSQVLKTNVRVIAATNVDLEERVNKGKFREDLYYRLSTIPVKVPSLKERREDILLLFRKFSTDFAEKYRVPPIQLDERSELLLENYVWPGNVRELKNVAEQVSVLAEERLVTADMLLQLLPQLMQRNLPQLSRQENGQQPPLQEREILYKLLFDMKGDLNDLKRLVFELISNNNLQVPADTPVLKQLASPIDYPATPPNTNTGIHPYEREPTIIEQLTPRPTSSNIELEQQKPFLLDRPVNQSFSKTEIVDEHLSIEDMEKDLIRKALKKHKGRRRETAVELGISERTLYRKIKQYDL